MKFKEVLEVMDAHCIVINFNYGATKVNGLFFQYTEVKTEKEQKERERILNMKVTRITTEDEYLSIELELEEE